MKTDNKIATGISIGLICLSVILFIFGLPYVLVLGSYSTKPYSAEEVDYLKKAVNCSLLKSQKLYTLNHIIPSLMAQNKVDETIAYFEKYENIYPKTDNLDTRATKTLVAMAYIEKGQYEKALILAESTNNLYQKANIYIKTNKLDAAKKTVEEIFSTKTKSKIPYLYVAQIQLKEGHLKSANESIDKLLTTSPQHLEALKTKAEILKALGKTTEYQKYIQTIEKIKQERIKQYGLIKIRGKDGNN